METTLQRSQGVDVRVREYTAQEVADLCNNGKAADVARCVNADRRQKVALVEFRSDLSEKINSLGFSRLTTTEQKDGQAVEVPAETEGKHIQRFADALSSGSFTPNDFTLIGQDDKAKEACAMAYLQKLAFTCGDQKDESGNPCYVLDITRPERAPSTGLVPKWATAAATKIINGESKTTVKSCIEMFTTGYTAPEGVTVDPIPFAPFDTKAPKGASPEEKQAVLAQNIKNLAKAIHAADRNKQQKLQAQNEFA